VINSCQIIFPKILPRGAGAFAMRVTDDRYTRDRQRFDLAWRLIHHEARTLTIRAWTGLSDDRIRKLYRSYVASHGPRRVRRHRGKSPRQIAFFFRSPEHQFHAAQLSSLYLLYGLLQAGFIGVESHYRVGSLESGALLCEAYEAYLSLHAPVRISFEHAWFLLLALARHQELALARCESCGGVRLCDLLAPRRSTCVNCSGSVGTDACL
jgi:hypothetical protein